MKSAAILPIIAPIRRDLSQSWYYNNKSLWGKIIDASPTIGQFRNETLDSQWTIGSNNSAANFRFPGTYQIELNSKDRIILEREDLLIIADMPDKKDTNLYLRFYNRSFDFPFLAFTLNNDTLEITGVYYNFPKDKAISRVETELAKYRDLPFIKDVCRTIKE